ncbi:MAG: discoidin domain-containing protein [Candidatus Diapherotrites archaeon]|nr:discoidin domain-containing protein [Candidatus Diapherotrites archaeon]
MNSKILPLFILLFSLMAISVASAQCHANSECDDGNPCTLDACIMGSCTHQQITVCMPGDGCCPSECTSQTDSDCAGNQTANDTCTTSLDCDDGNGCTTDICANGSCFYEPINCDDNNPCTADMCINNNCTHVPITICISGDGCCPAGCTSTEDDDCSHQCAPGDTKSYTCPDGFKVQWCDCSKSGTWTCILSPENGCIGHGFCWSDQDCEEGQSCNNNVCTEGHNQPPKSLITMMGECYARSACRFDASDSYDSDGYISYYRVSFGDGTIAEKKGRPGRIEHTYNSSGTYAVVLTTTDNDGLNNSYALPIYVKENMTVSSDLILERVSCPPKVTVGGRYEIPVEVYQKTEETTPLTYKIALYDNDEIVWITPVYDQKPNTNLTSYLEWYTTTPGQHKLSVVVDPFNDIVETNENNNKMKEPCEVYVNVTNATNATNRPPHITVVSPNGGEELRGAQKISWKAYDPDGEILDDVGIYYQPCRTVCPVHTTTQSPAEASVCKLVCGPSISIATHVKNVGSYLWDTSQVPNGRYKIEITVTDGTLWARDESNAPFSVVNEEKPLVFESCDNGLGYSIGDKNYSTDPSYCKSGLPDCCGWYQIAHVHDFKAPIKGPATLYVTVRPGSEDGCKTQAIIYKSTDNQNWQEIKRMDVISTSIGGLPGDQESRKPYVTTIHGVTDFRYIKVEVPKCYNTYSSVRVGEEPGPVPCLAIRTNQISRLKVGGCASVVDYKNIKLTLKDVAVPSIPGGKSFAIFTIQSGGEEETVRISTGETKNVFGTTLKLLGINSIKGTTWAAFMVNTEGSEIPVRLDKPFNLEEEQRARLVDYRVLVMRLDSIRKLPVIVPLKDGNPSSEEIPKRIKFVASITVWPTLERPTIIQENPGMVVALNTTAVKPKGLEAVRAIPVTGMVTSDVITKETRQPEQVTQGIKILTPIKKFVTNMTDEVGKISRAIEIEKVKERFYRRYNLAEGESIKVFGVKITLKSINEKYATFVITKEVPGVSCQEACNKEGYTFGSCAPKCEVGEKDLGTKFCSMAPVLRATKPITSAVVGITKSTPGYDKCNYGGGWSEPQSAAMECGWPPGKKGYIKDCCCCYTHTHVHDLGNVFSDRDVKIEYKPGWAQGCTTNMTVYYSTDGQNWIEVLNKGVTQETWHPKTIYSDTIHIPGKFRYIKVYIPHCYNDYSSAWVVGESKPSNEELLQAPPTTPIEPLTTHCCCKKQASGITFTIHKGWNLFSLPGQLSDVSTRGECDTHQWRVFEYGKENNTFHSIKYPEIGKGYWVYATGTCHITAKIKAPTLLDELDELTPGWNFVPVVPDMVGKWVKDLGNCDVVSTYFYSTPERRWVRLEGPISEKLYGNALLIKTNNICKLSEKIPLVPPSFPEEKTSGGGSGGGAIKEVY